MHGAERETGGELTLVLGCPTHHFPDTTGCAVSFCHTRGDIQFEDNLWRFHAIMDHLCGWANEGLFILDDRTHLYDLNS